MLQRLKISAETFLFTKNLRRVLLYAFHPTGDLQPVQLDADGAVKVSGGGGGDTSAPVDPPLSFGPNRSFTLSGPFATTLANAMLATDLSGVTGAVLQCREGDILYTFTNATSYSEFFSLPQGALLELSGNEARAVRLWTETGTPHRVLVQLYGEVAYQSGEG